MGAVISYSAYKQGVRLGSGRRFVEPVVAEIVQALLIHGGSAHRQIVADHIAASRAGRPVPASRAVQDEVFAGFQRYLDMAATRRPAPLLHVPLGSGSYRWALTASAETLFMRKTASKRQVH